jgi:hypothetical protein
MNLIQPPPNKHVVNTKWLFQRKHKSNGSLTHYKMNLVARKFTSQEGFVYVEKNSPIMKMTSLDILFALDILYDYHIH